MNSENPDNEIAPADEISLKELLLKIGEWYRYLLSKWLVILSFAIIGGLLGLLYAYVKKPVYTASTTFVLEDSGSGGGGLGQYAGLASMVGIDVGGGGGGIFQGDNILELYKSRVMIEKTLLSDIDYNGKKQLLVDRYIDFNKLRDKWKDKPELKDIQFKAEEIKSFGLSKPKFTRLQDSILGKIITDISDNYLEVTKPDKKLSIIKADVKAIDEVFAKEFNDQIVKNVNDFYLQTKNKKSLENVAIMQRKTDSVRAVMNGAIYSAAAVADATPNLNPTRQVQRIAPVQRSQFSAETNKEILGELVKNLEMSKIALHKETPLIQIVDQPVFPLEVKKQEKIKSIILGGILVGLLSCFVLIIRRLLKMILV